MSAHESEKAARYIALLNTARLNGNWQEVPALLRKIEKHAPQRHCLALTATTEAQLATAAGSKATTTFSDAVPKLLQAIEQEKRYPEDALQAVACLNHVYYVRGEWGAILTESNTRALEQATALANGQSISPWTRVCVVKSSSILGIAQENQGSQSEAVGTYARTTRLVEETPKDVALTSEYRQWAERLLARACHLAMQDASLSTVQDINNALTVFRSWLRFWDKTGTLSSVPSSGPSQSDVPRRRIWLLYFQLLSAILWTDHVYASSSDATVHVIPRQVGISSNELSALRRRQRGELNRVEAAYESVLLLEIRFPKANQSNEEVENWASQSVENWKILCGPGWSDADIGDGGKESVSRALLDILYRAATKTFHSPPILRHLFTVHAAIAEFDLAFKAFETYAEIISKSKSRVDRTGAHEVGQDDDDVVLHTAAEAINLMCLYGTREHGERALDTGKKVTHWIQQQHQPTQGDAAPGGLNGVEPSRTVTDHFGSPKSLAAVYHAIGRSQANWAHYTYDPAQRSSLRTQSIKSLQTATRHATQFGGDSAIACTLAEVLAESRNVPAAIQVLKKALAPPTSALEDSDRERKLVPLWHLLALLLTARGDYDTAISMCDAAFDLSTKSDASLGQQGDVGNGGLTEKIALHAKTDQLEESEKEGLIQIKITEMTILELLEDSGAAVDQNHALLALYARLFGDPTVGQTAPQKATPMIVQPPVKSGGTLKSIRGSILGKPKSDRKSVESAFGALANENASTRLSADTDPRGGSPIRISVTDEDGQTSEKHHKHHIPHHPWHIHGHHGEHGSNQSVSAPVQSDTTAQTTSGARSFPEIAHNLDNNKQPDPIGHGDRPQQQDTRLPAPHPGAQGIPSPRFASAKQRRRRVSLLIQIWLYSAGLYIRAELLEDSTAAIDEAYKLVEGFEFEVSQEESSARAFEDRGWGAGRSVNRLWADVWAERGKLAIAMSQPYKALADFEQALSYYPDHPAAIVAISALLLDVYEEKIPAEAPRTSLAPQQPSPLAAAVPTFTSTPGLGPVGQHASATPSSAPSGRNKYPSPAELNRLAARDRAYMLLSMLTKLGSGWDNAEAWFALSRAYELSGQVEKAKECLWWVVELEDARPVRPWSVVSGKAE